MIVSAVVDILSLYTTSLPYSVIITNANYANCSVKTTLQKGHLMRDTFSMFVIIVGAAFTTVLVQELWDAAKARNASMIQ